MKKFPNNAKFLRAKRKLTQPEIKERLGIEPTTWSNYERGKSSPNLKLFCEIAKFFEVPETELLHADLSEENMDELHEKYHLQNSFTNLREADEKYLSAKDEMIALLQRQINIMEKSMADKEKIIGYLEEKLQDQTGKK